MAETFALGVVAEQTSLDGTARFRTENRCFPF